MRADRLLSILMLLQVHRRMTVRELAQRLEVSDRTIQRDLEALAASGVPVYAERGGGGGWRLPDGYETKLTGLTGPEIQALFLTPPGRLLGDLGLQDAARGAAAKLLASLPAGLRQGAEYARQRILVDMSTWRGGGGPATPCLPTLQDAVWQDRQLAITYLKSDTTNSERVVEPLGLVARGTVWYLVAVQEGTIKSFRADRITAVRLLEAPVVRPPGFDLEAHWAESKQAFVASLPRYAAVVRVRPEILSRMRWSQERVARVERVDQPDDSGWQRVALRFDTEEEAVGYALSYGADLEVLEPAALRERVVAVARSVVSRYQAYPDS